LTVPFGPGRVRIGDALFGPSRWSVAERLGVRRAIDRVLAGGSFVLGREVDAFEREFSARVGASECVGVGNGTDALTLALMALDLPVGSEVMVAANAGFFASIAAVRAGLRPIAVDIDPDTLQLDTSDLEARRTERCRAVVWTHLYGQVTELSELADKCGRQGIKLIEDCAQAAGATVGGKAAGSWGAAGTWSFYPTKNLAALGDGGAVTTSDGNLAARVRSLRNYGAMDDTGALAVAGVNSRLDELQAAVLRSRLAYVDDGNARRRSICAAYRNALPASVGRVVGGDADDFNGHLAVVDSGRRDEVAELLAVAGISTRVRYPVPSHRAPAFGGFSADSRPEAERACRRVLCLPCSPGMTDEEVSIVCASIAALP